MTQYNDPAARILVECADLIEKKNSDYNTGFSRDEYALYGERSHMQSIHTKYLRLRSLLEHKRDINFESIEDTLKDLACYSAIFIDWMRRQNADK